MKEAKTLIVEDAQVKYLVDDRIEDLKKDIDELYQLSLSNDEVSSFEKSSIREQIYYLVSELVELDLSLKEKYLPFLRSFEKVQVNELYKSAEGDIEKQIHVREQRSKEYFGDIERQLQELKERTFLEDIPNPE